MYASKLLISYYKYRDFIFFLIKNRTFFFPMSTYIRTFVHLKFKSKNKEKTNQSNCSSALGANLKLTIKPLTIKYLS